MKISYNWLNTLIKTDLTPQQMDEYLTASGLEVEGIDTFESVKGGLKGIVVGEVIEKSKHPDADKLSVTKVNVGTPDLLNIVCGAPNVEAGQKVLVALIGAKLYPNTGETFEIKKSKIRGMVSEGMICAEDEIGLGTSHDGIMILPNHAIVGTPAADFFQLKQDSVLEI
jgi:phenylalanyl-tRNA synthetase beta chain